jgi:hypothetical protein
MRRLRMNIITATVLTNCHVDRSILSKDFPSSASFPGWICKQRWHINIASSDCRCGNCVALSIFILP